MGTNRSPAAVVRLAMLLSVACISAVARGQDAAPAHGVPGAAAQPDPAKAFQNSIGMTLVPIPAGEFVMGTSERNNPDGNLSLYSPAVKWWELPEGPPHKVRISKPFYLGATEVTQNQWKAVMGTNPSADANDGNLPVDQVGWDDCRVFLKRLSDKEGRAYRLPTEAEWEYACRAGTTTRFSFGDDPNGLAEYAWHTWVSPRQFRTHPVGLKKPNAWGLYDMHGNVWEWCSDRYTKAYDGNAQTDPIGVVKDWGDRVMRGGTRSAKPVTGTSTCRNAYEGDYRMEGVGFRVALSSLEAVPATPTRPGEAKPLSFDQRVSAPAEKARLERLGAVRNGVGMLLMPIPAGDFTMGSEDTKYEQPAHKVKITKPFLMGATEVTQAQWKAVMGGNPSLIQGDDLPVESVTWEECQAFVKKLSEKEGKAYRLPTEAEWEYACRAGSTTRFHFGDDANGLGECAWHGANSDCTTHPVGMKKPSAWGLYDMYGNVWEWCQDYIASPYDAKGEQADPTGPAEGSQRVFRGGAWYDEVHRCRSAFRNSRNPNSRNYFGLRAVMMP